MDASVEIKTFVNDYLKKAGRTGAAGEKMPLVANADLDSLFVVELTIFIEKKFNLNFRKKPIERVHLDTLGSLIDFVNESARPT